MCCLLNYNHKKPLSFFKVLKENKYSHSHTFFAIYEINPLMRRRQAEILLGRSVKKTFKIFQKMNFHSI
jgi:hypothetical protein